MIRRAASSLAVFDLGDHDARPRAIFFAAASLPNVHERDRDPVDAGIECGLEIGLIFLGQRG